jgi:hypothetical protein
MYSKVWHKQRKKLNKPVNSREKRNDERLCHHSIASILVVLAADKALRSFSDLPFPLSDESNNLSDPLTSQETVNDVNHSHQSVSIDNNDSQTCRTYASPMHCEPREIQSGLSPLYLLNQLKRDTKFEFIVENSTSMIDEQHEFQVVAIIDEHRFVGTGRSKRIAKTRAAQLALEKLFGMCFDKEGK